MRRQAGDSERDRSKSYRKQVVEQNSASKIKEKIFSMSTNLTYTFGGGINKIKSFLSSSSSKQHVIFYIHGQKFATEKEAKEYFKKIIWFSYRRLPGLTKQLHSDTGWGCLIRVGQMALAAGLKKYMESKKGQKFLTYQEIVIAFVQNGGKQEKYSLKKIVQKAQQKFSITYGDWFKPFQICDVLASLHNSSPMKDAQNLKIHHFNQAFIDLQTIFFKLGKPMCKCTKRRILCEICMNVTLKKEDKSMQTLSNFFNTDPRRQSSNLNSELRMRLALSSNHRQQKMQKKLLLFVTCRAGCQSIKSNSYQQILSLLKLECSLGIIGGVPRKGYYFIGCEDDKLIYLDPHCVQDEVTLAKLHLLTRTFQAGQLRKVGQSEVDPSMAFVFYIDGLENLKKLHAKLEEFKENPEPIIFIDWVNQIKTEEVGIKEEEDEDCGDDMENSFIAEL